MGSALSCVKIQEKRPLRKGRRISKRIIGLPTNFQHVAHGGADGMVMNYGTTNSQMKNLKKDMEDFAKLLDNFDDTPLSPDFLSKREENDDTEIDNTNQEDLDRSIANIIGVPPPESLPNCEDSGSALIDTHTSKTLSGDKSSSKLNSKDEAAENLLAQEKLQDSESGSYSLEGRIPDNLDIVSKE